MNKKCFIVFPEYEDEVHAQKDPGIIADLLSQKYDTSIVCTKPSQKKHLCLPLTEIRSGDWLPDGGGTVIAYFQRRQYKPLYQKAKDKNYKLITKADNDGCELQKIFDPFNPAIYTQLRTDHLSVYSYIRHFRKFIYLEGWAKRKGYGMVDHIIMETISGQQRFIQALPQFQEKVVYIPNGVFFEAKNLTTNKKNQIIAVGRWEDIAKFPELLIDVLKETLPDSNYTALIIGGYDEKLLNKYNELPFDIKDKILLLGKKTFEEVQKYLAESKIFLSTSRWESSGLASLEALNNGCGIVCTDTGVANQTLHGLTGTVSKSLTIKDVTDALHNEIELWNTGVRSSEKIIAAAQSVFDWKIVIKKIEELM
jgi:glycosyltransferase involved in cell wall biosynthesis